MDKFWAHSDPTGLSPCVPDNQWQLLADHLRNVAACAQRLAESAAPQQVALHQMAHLAGMLHDYGKYTECFQKRIKKESNNRCPHSIHGAIAVRQFGLKPGETPRRWAMPVVHAIAAHHGGLLNDTDILSKTNAGARSKSDPKRRAPDPDGHAAQAEAIRERAFRDLPEIEEVLRTTAPPFSSCTKDLFSRILLSCLVDADRLDSAGRQPSQAPLQASERLNLLLQHLGTLQADVAQHGSNSAVLQVRQQVQELCRTAASGDARLLSLAVPTGGGKTLAAMRFALERAAAFPNDYRRVIVVIPYLSIIEQNAEVYRTVFGDNAIFEHHSGAVYALERRYDATEKCEYIGPKPEPDSDATLPLKRPETENWDAPVIVTTSVRFFESLFSNHPSDLRRVHNIARSIIVLDEVQTLPRRLLQPLLDMLRELTQDWGSAVVMATATQPAFEARTSKHESYAWPAGTITPIIPPERAAEMHAALRRVHIEWRIEHPTPWPTLAAEMLQHPQALCVVNVRQHAAKLYDELLAQSEPQQQAGIFHLSTRMCAQHRLDVLAVIRQRLKDGLTCRVVSTQLIEAGVDVDFPIAFRALGPLDAIIQVAGRVDREGKLTAAAGKPAGRLIVFKSEDGRTPPYEYKEATAVTQALARERDLQTDDLIAMQSYFERYYGDADDQTRGKPLADMRADDTLAFATLAEQFEMINSRMKDVFVPYGAKGNELTDELQASFVLNGNLLQRLQRYSVGLQPWDFNSARSKGLIQPHPHIEGIWTASTTAYDEAHGLREEHDLSKFVQ
jgi:CRISPR-associated endonuclease/helicase Cas3